MPQIALSDTALALFRLHVERHGNIVVDDSNCEIFQELKTRRADGLRTQLPGWPGQYLPADKGGIRAESRAPGGYRAIARHSRRASSLIGNFVFGAAFSAAACDPS